jgi:hypothetical protein
MRLLGSDSSDVTRVLASRDCILVRRKLYDLPVVVVGNAAIVVFILIARVAVPTLTALEVGLALLLIWNLLLAVRRRLGKTNWVVAASGDCVLAKLFAPRGLGSRLVASPNVLEMRTGEIASVWSKTTDIIWPRTKPSVVEWLVIEPSSTGLKDFEKQAQGLFPSSETCDPYREWFAAWRDTRLLIPWDLCRPGLPEFWTLVRAQKPNLTILEGERSSVDLRVFWSKPEQEQRELLTKAKRLGYGLTCILMLKRHRNMARAEALRYLSSLGTDLEERAAP